MTPAERRAALTIGVGQALYQWAVNRVRIQALTETDTRRLHDGALLLVVAFLAHELPEVTEQDTRTHDVAEARYQGALAMWDAMGGGDKANTARVLTEALHFNLHGPGSAQPDDAVCGDGCVELESCPVAEQDTAAPEGGTR